MTTRVFDDADVRQRLVNSLERNQMVRRVALARSAAQPAESAQELVFALESIEESCLAFLGRLGIIAHEVDEPAQTDQLIEILEDMRHIIFHLQDCRFFQSLFEPSPDNGTDGSKKL